jgi:hypothetical protein
MSSRVGYQERYHRYSLDGEWVPSVTTVTSKALDKPGLAGAAAKETAAWAAIHVDELPQLGEEAWRRQATGWYRAQWADSRDRGTLLHDLAEALVGGDPLPSEAADGTPYPDDVYASAQQLARFMDAWHVNPLAHEAIVWHETDRWAGRLDLIADLADGNRWLLDYKTGASGIWPETSLQLAAYAHATHIVHKGEDVPMPQVDRAAAVWVRPDQWQLIPVAIGDAVYDVFRHAMPVAAWAKLDRDQSVGAPLPEPTVA